MLQPNPFEINISSIDTGYQTFASWMAGSEPWITLGMDQQKCLKAFEGEGKEIYIIEKDGSAAGFVILQTIGSFKGYIQTLFIHPDFQGVGLGTALLEYCEKRIAAFSPNIFICVSEFNTGAIKLYESFGFRKVGVLENFVKEGYAELLYRKSSGPLNTFIAS
jgi:[ribosomal protein S18]-alanine N-acetyltransferase